MKTPDLGQMVGPLPLGGWLVVVGGGVGLAVLGRKKTAAADTAAAAPAPADTTGWFTPAAGSITGGTVPLVTNGATTTADTIKTPAPVSNDEWAREVMIVLVGRGYGAFATQNTLSKYLEGRQLTAEEQIIVEAALRAKGPPPMPPISIPVSLEPITVPKPSMPPTTPEPPPADCPMPPAGFPGAPGEVIIKKLPAPGGGCWWITNLGGVANTGGAPFKGSAISHRMGPGYETPPRFIVDAVVLGKGYRLVSNYPGQTYDFP